MWATSKMLQMIKELLSPGLQTSVHIIQICAVPTVSSFMSLLAILTSSFLCSTLPEGLCKM